MASDKTGSGYLSRAVNGQWAAIGRLMLGRRLRGVLERTEIHPVYSSIVVTHNCNYKCQMCSFWHDHTEGELTAAEIDTVLGDLRAAGVAQINFTGGEPFLRKDLLDIVRSAKAQGFKMIQITSNGSLTTQKKLEAALEAGVGRIAMSVDGWGENHETQRGVPGAWKKAIRTLDALRALRESRFPKLEVELAMVVSKLNLHDLDEVLALCDEYGAVLHLQFLDHVQFFTAEESPDLELSPEDVDALVDRVHHHIDHAKAMDPLLTHQAMEYIRRVLKGEDPNADLPTARCGVGFAMVYVDALGNVYPGCFAMPPVGNVRETPLRDLIDSDRHRSIARDCFDMNCPGCPNGYAWNVFTNPRAIAAEARTRIVRNLRQPPPPPRP